MGRGKPRKNLTAKDILLKCNWFVEYNYSRENLAEINISWIQNGKAKIEYNPKTETLYSDFHNKEVKIPKWAVNSFIELFLNDIALGVKYPPKYLFYKYLNNPCKNLKFDQHLNKEERVLQENIQLLIEDVEKNGLRPSHPEIARDLEVFDVFNTYMQSRYKVNLELKLDESKQ